MTIGGNGNYSFSGVISNGGLTVAAAASATGSLVFSNTNTYTGKTTLNSGTLLLTNVGRAGAITSDLEVAGGTLNLGAGTKTNAAFTLSGGVITNGTLEATTYALNGGTNWGNLGTGTIDVGGTVTLNGTAAATAININSGTLTLGSASRLTGVTPALAIAGGALTLGGNESVGSFTITSGTLGGSATLTASTYALQGGTINALLGAGAITVSSSTTALGSAGRLNAASSLTINSGQLTLGGNESVAAFSGAGGTLALGANTLTASSSANSAFSGTISGTGGALTKAGNGTLTLSSNNTFSGATTVSGGQLVVNGTNASSAVTVSSSTSLGGSGQVGSLTVSGIVAPGNSVGTLSAGSTVFNGGGAYELEMWNWNSTAGTGWDLLAITGDLTLSNTSGNKFTINLVSMSSTDTQGLSTNFNSDLSFTNTFVTYSGSQLGQTFAANLFTINTGSFSNSFGGTFSITNITGGLALLYTAPVATTESWWIGGSGLWSQSGNWSNNQVPSGGQKVYFVSAGGGLSTNDTADSLTGIVFTNGAGSFTVSGNTFTNGIQGVTNLSSASQTIDNNLVLGAEQKFDAVSGDLTFGGSINNNDLLLTVQGAANTALNGVVSGSGGLTKSGNGSLTLGTNNTFSGTLAANAGTVLVNGTQATATVNVGGGTLLLGASDVLANGATLTLSTGTVNLGGFSDTVGTFNQSGGVFTNGTLTAATYGLSGGTAWGNLGAGTINASGNFALNGAAAATTINITGGTFTLGSAGRLTGTTPTVLITNGATLTLGGDESIGTLNLTNGTVGGSGILSVSSAINAQQGTLSANIGGAAGLTKTTANTVTLSGTNSFAGAVAVNDGVLALTNGSALSDSAAVTLADTAGVTLKADSNETIGSLAGGGTNGGTVALGVNTLTLNQSGNTTYSGAITGAGLLAKSGVGTLTLTNTSGLMGADFDLLVSQGTVELSRGTAALGGLLGAGNKVILNGGTFQLTALSGANFGITNGGFDVTANSTLFFNRTGLPASHSPIIGGALTFSNNATLNIAYNANINAGNTTLGGAANVLYSDGTINTTNYSITITNGFSESGGARSLTKTGAGTVSLQGASTYTGNTIIDGGVLRLAAAGSSISDSSLVSVASGASMNFTNINDTVKGISGAGTVELGSATLTTSNAATDTFSGTITGTGAYTKVGAGTQVLSGAANTYSGTTTVGGGMLQVSTLANSNSNSSIGSGSSVVLTGGGVLDYTGSTVGINRGFSLTSGNGGVGVSNAATELTISGAITGAGDLVKSGAGTVTLSGSSANTFSGATTVSAGTLQLNKSTDVAAIAGNITVNSGATLLLSSSGNVANTSAVTLSGGTITRGSGVNEAFASLNLTTGSFLDFGTGTTGSMTFGTYEENTTPSALLAINNFLPGNSFTFSNAQFAANGSNVGSFFTFGTGFQGQSISDLGAGSFTITAIPEPSTYLAAAGLLGLMLWPSRKRIVRDAKKILGFTPPIRDKLAARSKA